MTFTETQQKAHRKSFIEECRQKAWGATCHADWISKGIDDLLAHYQKLQNEDKDLETGIDVLAKAPDYHTVDNREKRKEMQIRRNTIAGIEIPRITQSVQQGRQAMQQLLQSAETSLQLAKHAEEWEWKEVEASSSLKAPEVA